MRPARATVASLLRAAPLLWAGAVAAQDAVPVGGLVPQERLFDAEGSSEPIDVAAGTKGLILVWFHTACPVARASMPEVVATARAFAAGGVRTVLVDAHAEEVAAVVAAVKERAPGIELRFDRGGGVARALGVTRVPTALVVDASRRLRYRGRIFERFTGRDEGLPQTGRLDLRRAVEDVLAGREVTIPETRTAGCLVPPAEPATSRPTTGITYAASVAPLFARHCTECHSAGGPGPMPLTTYAEVRPYVHDVAELVWDGMMPPWREDGHGLRLAGERRLSDREKGTIIRWVHAGAPEGERGAPASRPAAADAAPATTRTRTDEIEASPFGVPYELTREYELGPDEGEERVIGVVATWFQPSAIVSFLVTRARDDALLGFLTPHGPTLRAPDGAAWRFGPKERVRVRIRVRPQGVAVTDKFSVGIAIAPSSTPAAREPRTLILAPERLSLAAGDAHATVIVERALERATVLVAFLPDLRHLGREAWVDLVLPGGATRRLAGTSHWDPRRRDVWAPLEPFRAPAGARLRFTAIYDNSETNRRNPDVPPKDVVGGDGPRREKCELRVVLIDD
jgi:hypothetical protein